MINLASPLSRCLRLSLIAMAGWLLGGFGLPLTAQDAARTGNPDAPATLRVMSFNLRYGTARDGNNRWELRRDNVVTTIREFDPDLLGTQETLPFQADYLKQNLAGYNYVGRTRDLNSDGEQCGILYRRDRFDQLAAGHFWLSETPNVPASKSWDSSLPRMVSWVKLHDRKSPQPSTAAFYLVNTHFDHIGQQAREKSADLIRQRLAQFESGVPIILTGDLNTRPDTAPIATLRKAWTDTYADQHDGEEQAGTFGGFRGRTDGPRIDYIFVSPAFSILQSAIVRRNFDGHDPSDHFPVTAVLALPAAGKPRR